MVCEYLWFFHFWRNLPKKHWNIGLYYSVFLFSITTLNFMRFGDPMPLTFIKMFYHVWCLFCSIINRDYIAQFRFSSCLWHYHLWGKFHSAILVLLDSQVTIETQVQTPTYFTCFFLLALYGEDLILSPNTTCPRFSDGALSSLAEQKSKLKSQMFSMVSIGGLLQLAVWTKVSI